MNLSSLSHVDSARGRFSFTICRSPARRGAAKDEYHDVGVCAASISPPLDRIAVLVATKIAT
jgi:hypothetical protein